MLVDVILPLPLEATYTYEAADDVRVGDSVVVPFGKSKVMTGVVRRVGVERPDVKVVVPRGVFFGGRQGEWRLPDFSLSLLARKNMIPALSLYRKEDGLNIGGYSKEIIAREDWEFWIRMLKDGGEVVKIWDETGLRYRISKNSKRERDREYMRLVIDYLNLHHADFLKRELGGPLRYHRSWSKLINRIVALFPKRLSSWLSRFSISLLETEIGEKFLPTHP